MIPSNLIPVCDENKNIRTSDWAMLSNWLLAHAVGPEESAAFYDAYVALSRFAGAIPTVTRFASYPRLNTRVFSRKPRRPEGSPHLVNADDMIELFRELGKGATEEAWPVARLLDHVASYMAVGSPIPSDGWGCLVD